jgi:hypothetical protein
MFVEIVTESKTFHIYKAVLLTIKVAARNISRTHTHTQHNQAPNEQSNPQYNTVKLGVGLLLLKKV